MVDLIDEQIKVINKIKKFNDGSYIRKKNLVLLGEIGSGKTTILKKLSEEKDYKYINFTEDYLEKFYKEHNFSFKYFNSNDFFKFVENEFGSNSSFLMFDSIEPILVSLYNNDKLNSIKKFFDNFYEQQALGGILLSIPVINKLNLDQSLNKSKLNINKNLIKLNNNKELKRHLSDIYQLPSYRVNKFKNNHYFRKYRGLTINEN